MKLNIVSLLLTGAFALGCVHLSGCANPRESASETSREPAGFDSGPKAVTTASGLKYMDLTIGKGKPAERGSVVSVHYTGTLENGTEFDSSVSRGQPFTFTLGAGQVIKGWDEGISGMQEGGKRVLTIPSWLAYGKRGAPPSIPPDATLVFEVELLEVQ